MKNLPYANLSANSGNFINVSVGIITFFVIGWVLVVGQTIILPMMIALFLSFVLDPIVNLFTRIKLPLAISVFLTLLLAFIFLYLVGLLIYASIQNFINELPVYVSRLEILIKDTTLFIEKLIGQPIKIKPLKRLDWLNSEQSFSIARGLLSSVGTFVTFVFKMFLVIIIIAFLLMGKRNISDKVFSAFQKKQANQITSILHNITTQIQKYIGAKMVISFFTGAFSLIVFFSFGLDFAIFWAFIIFLFNFIPNIGSIIASILPALFSILQFGSFAPAFWLILIVAVIQIIMGNVAEPRLMGRSLNLSPLMVILSLIFWGYIWGIAGMILAVPILGTITIIFENIASLRFISVFLRGNVSKSTNQS
ncbi:MAG: AI-2E family transporter [Caldithrix sp.]|nr:AI-2E family transporter [Caldithrix sp.]